MSRWINIQPQDDLGLSRRSVGRVPAAPVAIGFEIVVGIMGPQAIALFVDEPCLDLGCDAVPVAIDRRRKRAGARPSRSQLALAQIARNGFDIAPGFVHRFTIAANVPQRDWLASHPRWHAG